MKKDNKNITLSVVDAKSIAEQVPLYEERLVQKKPYISYGADNKFPQFLFDTYTKSAILQSIVNGTTNYVMGDGIDTSLTIVNDEGETIDDIVKKITTDYLIFGGFAIDVIRDSNMNVKQIYWLDFAKVRLDKDGKTAYYSNGFGKFGSSMVSYPVFDAKKKEPHSVFYFRGHKTRSLYPICLYNGALNAILTSIEISKFHLNAILNNFNVSAIINFNNGTVTDEYADTIENKIKEKFCSADNASKFMLIFNDSKEHATEVTRLTEDNFDAKYEALRNDTINEIFVAFGATPTLFGLPLSNIGFNSQEFSEAYELYNKIMIIPLQNDIKRSFNAIYDQEDIITFKPFTIYNGEEGGVI